MQSDTIRKKSKCPLFFQFTVRRETETKDAFTCWTVILITVLIWLTAHIFAFTADKQE